MENNVMENNVMEEDNYIDADVDYDNIDKKANLLTKFYEYFIKSIVVMLLYYLLGMKSISAYLNYYLPRGLDKLIYNE